MTWPFENDTAFITRKLAKRSFAANRMRNIIALIAITLTAVLFTSMFTLSVGMKESLRQANMILSGGDGHASMINLNESEYEAISAHPLVKEISYGRKLADSVDNKALSKRDTLFQYYDDTGLKYLFIEPASGHKPTAENEIIMDTHTLNLLGVPRKIGEEITLKLTLHERSITRSFVLTGWWESYPGVTYGTIVASKAYVQAHADELTYTYDEDHSDTGAISARIKFSSDKNIAEDLKTVLKDCGYSSDFSSPNYVNANVNSMYTSLESSTKAANISALVCTLLLFLFSGYLIIYNIFQISILRDLHFYGMLKTIGATKRQINAVVCKQAWRLAAVGVPAGLCAGFLLGKLLLPMLMADTSFPAGSASVPANPLIFIGSAIFTLVTVYVSTRKPAKTAASVSPVEAIRYTDSDTVTNEKETKRLHSGGASSGMAWANFGRNKKRTALVVLSLSLSIILTSTVFTFSRSVNPEKAIVNMMDSDFSIGQSKLFDRCKVSKESSLSESYIAAVCKQNGFKAGGAEYGCRAVYKSETTTQDFNRLEDGTYATHLYGLDNFPFSRLQLFDGELYAAKLASGKYILEGAYVNSYGDMDMSSLNHEIGDKIELLYHGKTQEFIVLGHVIANEANTYDWVGSCFFLMSDIYRQFTDSSYPMSYKFDVENGAETETEKFLEEYTSNVEPEMTYRSKITIMAGVKDIQNIIVSVGGAFALIIDLIGILNFVNILFTGIFARRRELAILQSIGMTSRQLRSMLCKEGCSYIFISAIISIPLTLLGAYMRIRPVCHQIWFLDFSMNPLILPVMIVLLLFMGILVSYFACRIISRQSVVERLRYGG